MKRLRVRGFVVQPLLSVDDGDTLEDITVKPFTVTAAEWATYAADTWPQALADLQAQVDPGA